MQSHAAQVQAILDRERRSTTLPAQLDRPVLRGRRQAPQRPLVAAGQPLSRRPL